MRLCARTGGLRRSCETSESFTIATSAVGPTEDFEMARSCDWQLQPGKQTIRRRPVAGVCEGTSDSVAENRLATHGQTYAKRTSKGKGEGQASMSRNHTFPSYAVTVNVAIVMSPTAYARSFNCESLARARQQKTHGGKHYKSQQLARRYRADCPYHLLAQSKI